MVLLQSIKMQGTLATEDNEDSADASVEASYNVASYAGL